MGKCKALETALNNKLLSSHEHLKKGIFSPPLPVQVTRGKKAGGSKGLVLTVANFLATEPAQCSGDWHHRMRLVETLSTVCRMTAWP